MKKKARQVFALLALIGALGGSVWAAVMEAPEPISCWAASAMIFCATAGTTMRGLF
jgi:hypothetical protein